MKVVVPFSNQHTDPIAFEAVARNLSRQNIPAKFFEMVSENGYAVLINRLWGEGSPFIIVEHDIIPWPGALQQLSDCPKPWCGFSYGTGTDSNHRGLGCTKFDPAALGECPVEFSENWMDLDNTFNAVLNRERGYGFHAHHPPVSHLRKAA